VGAPTLFATHYFELTRLAEELHGVANVHLDAVEHAGGIVFLHAVEEGPASQSYGLQVAQLAGIPAPVIRAARARLHELEQQSVAAGETPDLFRPLVRPASSTLAAPVDEGAGVPSPDDAARVDPAASGGTRALIEPGPPAAARPGSGEPGADEAIVRALREIDPDALSPREALDLVYRLAAKIRARD